MVNLKNKSVLVTGSTGFIGTHLVRRLTDEGAAVFALSRTRSRGLPAQVRQIEHSLESLTPEAWQEFSLPTFDLVFHLGGFAPKDGLSSNDLDLCYSGNVLGTRQLLASIDPVPEKLIFASTLDVYAAPTNKQHSISEDSPVGPRSLYGSSKLFCEDYIRHWANRYGSTYVCLRFGHIYGPGEDAYKKLIPEVMRGYLAHRPPLLYGDGSAMRDVFYVDDAVEATVRSTSLASHSTINVVSGKSLSVREIVEQIAFAIGVQPQINYAAEKPQGESFKFDNLLLLTLLGQWPFVPLIEGLRQEFDSLRTASFPEC